MRKAIKIKHPTEDRDITVCECCVNDYETIDDVSVNHKCE